MIQRRTLLNIVLTAALCVGAPYVFALIVGYWSLLLVPFIQALGLTSQFGIVITMGFVNALGALLAAAVMAIPLGWFVREWALLYGCVVGVVASFVLLYWAPPLSSAFEVGMRVVEYLSFVVGCMFFSLVGAHLVRRRLV
ncbi:MAG: hypothetical protein ACLGGY_03410 [Gammaproteobacteria bacterium]